MGTGGVSAVGLGEAMASCSCKGTPWRAEVNVNVVRFGTVWGRPSPERSMLAGTAWKARGRCLTCRGRLERACANGRCALQTVAGFTVRGFAMAMNYPNCMIGERTLRNVDTAGAGCMSSVSPTAVYTRLRGAVHMGRTVLPNVHFRTGSVSIGGVCSEMRKGEVTYTYYITVLVHLTADNDVTDARHRKTHVLCKLPHHVTWHRAVEGPALV